MKISGKSQAHFYGNDMQIMYQICKWICKLTYFFSRPMKTGAGEHEHESAANQKPRPDNGSEPGSLETKG